MTEIKNNFLGAKMNQDIDDRLLSSNEYRYALNLQINRSENSDAGTLQNVLGNSLTANFNTLTGSTGLECIGTYADDSKNRIYIFLTNNTGANYNTATKNFLYLYDISNLNSPLSILLQGSFLNFSTLNPVIGISIIEDLLFWTDNRNQPRRINVEKALTSSSYYQYEEQISVAKINPLYTMDLFKLSFVAPGQYETSMYDVVSAKLPNNTTDNPYIDNSYAGDPAYLEDKFVRFSYRYRFEDGEYSIMAPFTQIAYVPKQDGYFLYDSATSIDDEADTYRSTIVRFMRNKINNIFLQIKLPRLYDGNTCPANQLNSIYKISYIDILYKDSNESSVKVIDSIPTIPIPSLTNYFWNSTDTTYSYNYQSKKPFKTLPERDLIRVSDRVPIKALGQETIGNRVVYSNYQDRSSYPKYLDYNVGYGTKYPFGFSGAQGTSIKEYPNHSVKQNRNYQVGIVLCDRFGRESGVILSSSTTQQNNGTTFGASSLYARYLQSSDTSLTKPSYWPGNSLKVLFNEVIGPTSPDSITGWPGIYNGDADSASYNPLGWYSYKIVVKQTEQEYYNVYLPGVMASYPTGSSIEIGKTSHTVLINDNINKVPRDLTEVGPSQLQFRSSVILYPRVNNNNAAWKNQMFYPEGTYSIVSTIADNNSLFFGAAVPSLTGNYQNFYQVNSNPLIARISTPNQLGVIPTSSPLNVINLSVLETKPVESKLDIHWETSSTGLITELNTAIQSGALYTIKDIIGFVFSLNENITVPTFATSEFSFTNIADATITSNITVTLISAKTQDDVSVLDLFELVVTGAGLYKIKTKINKYFYYGPNPNILNTYTFNIGVTVGPSGPDQVSQNFITNGMLSNTTPIILNPPSGTINKNTGDLDVYDFNGSNGSGGSMFNALGLTWSVVGSNQFTIDYNGMLKTSNAQITGIFNLEITLTEVSGNSITLPITVYYPPYFGFTTTTGAINGEALTDTGSYWETVEEGVLTIYNRAILFWVIAETQYEEITAGGYGQIKTMAGVQIFERQCDAYSSIDGDKTSTRNWVNPPGSILLQPGSYLYKWRAVGSDSNYCFGGLDYEWQ